MTTGTPTTGTPTTGTPTRLDKFQLGLDFDDTLFLSAWPEVGPPVPGALETLRALGRDHEVEFILITLRTGGPLAKALERLERDGDGLEPRLAAVNDNPVQRMWEIRNDVGRSPKTLVDAYVDDKAVGVPLMRFEGRDVVDWGRVESSLRERMREWRRR